MPKIRVLVVDDAVVFRRLVSDALSADPALEVVGVAANGRIALAKLPQVNPDLVILDIEMPEMDGLATLREIRKTYPKLPVIMFSALTERGAAATLDALALGATDYFAKPAAGLEASLRVIREELIPEIKALCGRSPAPQATPPAATAKAVGNQGQAGPVNVVAIGTSTGGPNALAEVFAGLPGGFPVPVVIVQHMPLMFTRLLAERLPPSSLRVEEGRGRRPPTATPGSHLGTFTCSSAETVVKPRILLNQDPPRTVPAAVDVCFDRWRALLAQRAGLVLTGMGQDGLRGSEAIRAAGGQVMVQDESTSIVWECRVCRPGRTRRPRAATRLGSPPRSSGESHRARGSNMTTAEFDYVCRLVRDRSGIVLEPGRSTWWTPS